MRSGARTIFVIAAILVSLYAIVVLSAGIAQLSDLAARVHPAFGMFVGWTLGLAFLGLIAAPLVLYYRLPPPLIPPDAEAGAEHDAYLLALKRRLAANPRLRDRRIESDAELQDALSLLSSEADKVVRKAASTVFLGTAVMQNGRLDGLVVLAAQCRLVWQVAAVYYQRPSPRQMVYLYANVASTALLAAAIEDIDFSEIVAPIVVAAIPSLQGAVPGMQGITSLLVRSLSNGAANALLTLRVGAVARQYCEATSTPLRSDVRRSATAEALRHVGRIAKQNSALVAKGTWKALSDAAGSSIGSAVGGTRSLGSTIAGKFRRQSKVPTAETRHEETESRTFRWSAKAMGAKVDLGDKHALLDAADERRR